MINALFCMLISAVLAAVMGKLIIPLLKKLKAGQTVLSYVEEHKKKSGTPTMGGLFFLPAAVIVCAFFAGKNHKLLLVSCAIGLSYMIVGFLDDFIKIRFRQNEGLKPYQKIFFQLLIAFIGSFFAYRNGLTSINIPYTDKSFELGWFFIPFTVIVFLATTNSVNLTDGLDGLAGNVSFYYFIFTGIMIFLQTYTISNAAYSDELENMVLLCFSLSGALFGFLVYNTYPARVFMGDTGSLGLGGFAATIGIFSGNGLFIIPLGIMFVLSSISVILQVAHYKRTKKRIFLMAPLHHHFQMKGYSESKIVYSYSFITVMMGVSLLLIAL